jgi:protein disulfide-isomerase
VVVSVTPIMALVRSWSISRSLPTPPAKESPVSIAPSLPRTCSVLLALVTSLFLAVSTHAADEWLIKYDEAIAAAKKTGRPILANFTGSDWCGWCIKLKEEVFDTKEFKEWTAKNVVLLELDFPQKKPQDAAIKAKNQQLSEHYGVQGFPTILILNAEGKQLGELGYQQGGPKAWIENVTNQLKAAGKAK